MKKQRLMIALLATLGMGSALASTSSEYNIANGCKRPLNPIPIF
ncbi:hypothetical protein J704_1450 [Acinetobacter baumannii 1426993]|nr:hypothetical protein J704_1450 [Acinetobacter baumannii 1426993]